MQRLEQYLLIASTLVGCWLGMQAVHECGHVAAALLSGGRVQRVVLHPLAISRTDLAENPAPLAVAWAGPVFGAIAPLALWAAAAAVKLREAFVLRFFAGFCLIANGGYIGGGSFERLGDCRELLQFGAPIWSLWLFGAIAAPAGLWLWHGQGPCFGFASAKGVVNGRAPYTTCAAAAALTVCGLLFG